MEYVQISKTVFDFPINIVQFDKSWECPSLCTLIRICDAFGITLSQFFNDGSEPLSLSVRQKELIKKWSDLSESQKEKVDIFISGMLIQ